MRLLDGSTEEPKLVNINGMERRTLSGNSFSVQFKKSTNLFDAEFLLRMVFLTISASTQFDVVINSVVNYAWLQAQIPTHPRAVLEAIFRLKQAGLKVNLDEFGALTAKDQLHTFAILRAQNSWHIRLDDADHSFKTALPTLFHAVYHVVDFYEVQ